MGSVTIENPAPLAAIMDLASTSGSLPSTLRTALFLQWKAGRTWAARDSSGTVIATLMVVPTIDGVAEIAFQAAPAAAAHMLQLIRFAQLAFGEACESAPARLAARVRTESLQSNRLAALAGLQAFSAEGPWTLYEWRPEKWHRQSRSSPQQ